MGLLDLFRRTASVDPSPSALSAVPAPGDVCTCEASRGDVPVFDPASDAIMGHLRRDAVVMIVSCRHHGLYPGYVLCLFEGPQLGAIHHRNLTRQPA